MHVSQFRHNVHFLTCSALSGLFNIYVSLSASKPARLLDPTMNPLIKHSAKVTIMQFSSNKLFTFEASAFKE